MATLKNELLQGYLVEQGRQTALVPAARPAFLSEPQDTELDQFKQQVRTWMDLDSQIQKLQSALKERRQMKKELTTRILEFMSRYNIEDLNTREGKLRYSVVQVKPSLSQKMVRERLTEVYPTVRSAHDLVKHVFEETPRVERPTLRRVRVRNALDIQT